MQAATDRQLSQPPHLRPLPLEQHQNRYLSLLLGLELRCLSLDSAHNIVVSIVATIAVAIAVAFVVAVIVIVVIMVIITVVIVATVNADGFVDIFALQFMNMIANSFDMYSLIALSAIDIATVIAAAASTTAATAPCGDSSARSFPRQPPLINVAV
jgi:hypothetical protein